MKRSPNVTRESPDPLTISMFVYRCHLLRDCGFEEGIRFGRWARGQGHLPPQGTYMDWLNTLIGWQSSGYPGPDGVPLPLALRGPATCPVHLVPEPCPDCQSKIAAGL